MSLNGRPPRTIDTNPKADFVSTFLWFLFSVLYLTALIVLGMSTLRKGHTVLFIFGIFLPILWIVGALIGPSPRAVGAA
jgi:vacuolar-type H+-ATPase subunit I/STV1